MNSDWLALGISIFALLGQGLNAYLKVSILKEIGDRETALRKEFDSVYVRKEMCQSRGGMCL